MTCPRQPCPDHTACAGVAPTSAETNAVPMVPAKDPYIDSVRNVVVCPHCQVEEQMRLPALLADFAAQLKKFAEEHSHR